MVSSTSHGARGGPQPGSGRGQVSRQSRWEVNRALACAANRLVTSLCCQLSERKTKHMEPGGGWRGLSSSPPADLALGQQGHDRVGRHIPGWEGETRI